MQRLNKKDELELFITNNEKYHTYIAELRDNYDYEDNLLAEITIEEKIKYDSTETFEINIKVIVQEIDLKSRTIKAKDPLNIYSIGKIKDFKILNGEFLNSF